MLVPLQGAACCCQRGVCVCVLWSGLAGAAAGCRCRVLLSERCVRLETGMLMQLQRAVAGCCFMGAVRLELAYAAGPLQGAAAGAACGCCCQWCALWSGHAGATAVERAACAFELRFGAGMLAAGCHCKVLLEGVCVCACACGSPRLGSLI